MASWKVQKRIKQAAILNAYMFNLIIHIKAKVIVSAIFTDGFCSYLIPQRALHPLLPKTRSRIFRNTVDNHFLFTLKSWEATFIKDARFVQQRLQSASREPREGASPRFFVIALIPGDFLWDDCQITSINTRFASETAPKSRVAAKGSCWSSLRDLSLPFTYP